MEKPIRVVRFRPKGHGSEWLIVPLVGFDELMFEEMEHGETEDVYEAEIFTMDLKKLEELPEHTGF